MEFLLIRWLIFITELNERSNCCFFNPMVKALLDLSQNNDVFRSLSGYENELCFKYLNQVLENLNQSVIHDIDVCKKLLVSSFFFAKFPGLQKKSIKTLTNKEYSVFSENEFNYLFNELFISYESPIYLISNIDRLDLNEFNAFGNLIVGNKINTKNIIPLPISRKDYNKIYNLNEALLKFESDVFLRGLIYTRMNTALLNESKYTRSFLLSSITFKSNPKKYFDDIQFWIRAAELFLNAIANNIVLIASDCTDYLEYVKYQRNNNFTLRGRTSTSFAREINLWHNRIYENHGVNYDHLKWRGLNKKNLYFNFENNEYFCKQLKSGKALDKEGKALKHCVYTYANRCLDGNLSIWSLRKLSKKNKPKKIITIEVEFDTIVQARGSHNRLPSKNELAIIKDWAERLDFKMDLLKNY